MAQAKMKKKIFQGRYEILNIVGRGSCSVVYHGKLLEDDKSVALKVLVNKKRSEDLSDRLRQEALSLVSARHKNVIRLDDFHSIGNLSYLAMEYAPHADLATYIKNQAEEILPIEQALNYIFQMAEALSFVHKIGMLHRDIKPANILIMSKTLAKLGDFGVALLPGEDTDTKELQNGVGTIDYMAPEVFEGKIYNQSSDIYQLGVTAYEILSGKNPFNSSALVDLLKIRKDENIKPIKNIPSQISKVILKAISYDYKDRYEDVDSFIEDLNKAIENKLEENTSPKPKVKESESEYDPFLREEDEKTDLFDPDENELISETSKINAEEDQEEEKDLDKEKEDFFAFMEEMQKKVEKEKKEKAEKENQDNQEDDININNEKEKSQNSENTRETDNSEEEISFLNNKEPENVSHENKKEDIQVKSGGGSSFLEKALESSSEAIIDEDEQVYSGQKDENSNTEFNKNLQSQEYRSKRKPSSSLLKILIFLAVAYFAYTKFFATDYQQAVTNENYKEEQANQTEKEKILPKNSDGKDFNFPNLQSGTYAGEINNLIDGAKHPITLISEDNGKLVTLLIGINGFQPMSVKPELDSNTLVFRTNGFMLEFEAEKLTGFLRGTYTNLINKKTGRWYLKNILNN